MKNMKYEYQTNKYMNSYVAIRAIKKIKAIYRQN